MKHYLRDLLSAPFQLVLVISFSLVAALAIGIGAWVTVQAITEYQEEAMSERVARDMKLAQVFYTLALDEIAGTTHRLAHDPLVRANVGSLLSGDDQAQEIVDEQITNSLAGLTLGGNHLVAIVDAEGRLVSGRVMDAAGSQRILEDSAGWERLEVIQHALDNGEPIAGTEVIPADLLKKTGLAEQARIPILETPKAAKELYDLREGTAGLALLSLTPIKTESGEITGAIMAFHLINNDFTLVDRVREVAGIDTATIFFGDLRISTNVMTGMGRRAIGTRVSEEVSQKVLTEGEEYVGPAFVVNENYITRYDPISDHAGRRVGILYVGARQSAFYRLVNSFNQRIVSFALGTILLTIVLAIPVSRVITRPLKQLKDLVEANEKVAEGDLSVRVPVTAGGEVRLLTESFNSMVQNLQETQEQLVQSEKLASLGQLAAGVAHELNNPLGTILLYGDLLSKETAVDSTQKADLDVILSETKRCKSTVAALLEFARQNQVNAQPTDVNALIEQVLEVEKKHYEASNVELSCQLDASLPKIQADAAQLIQVLVNLVENAVDAMPEGGTICLRTLNEPDGMVTIEVADTGIGIPTENLGKLYTPFFTTKPIGKGTGLGLAIIYGIIKMHRGQINVRSVEGEGTTFIIQLPVRHYTQGNANQVRSNTNQQDLIKIGNGRNG